MRRWHFYVMGTIATVWGVLALVEYVMVAYGLRWGWLDMYPENQLNWLASLPAWVHGLWGLQGVLAFVGALCLLAHLRASVWMLGLSFLALLVLVVWSLFFAAPTLLSLDGLDGGTTFLVSFLVLLLSAMIWLYARSEKQRGEVL
ncbi:hypothetical protein [Jannaschia aquimarina]|uniref:Uncharacterized protein n=1 Tax=Jannaschia aquimarina TaxID=935700 RepID=A0A0D1EDZ4_9RHOB|nr:hypothetical protein [Jannaschia aquimarina]KIT15904.1 hypothetical protein jaqu_21720 [Jannaschia aquimarina]SNS97454.1 hypothetical protein SAMN05421775_10483 [Jannaschia aquimarina]